MGVFALLDQLENGMPAYKNPAGQYLYYYTKLASWYIGSKLGGKYSGVYSRSGPICPQNITESSWNYWANSQWNAGSLSVMCGVPGTSKPLEFQIFNV